MSKSELLKAELKKIGLKYKKIEELTYIPATSIQQYVSGRPCPPDRLKLLCLVLGIDEKIFVDSDRNSLQEAI